jgi:peptide/nickel transport system substrate-binding protein
MAVIRKRLIYWLIKAYIKKSGKTIVLAFLFGLCIFFVVAFGSKYFFHFFPFTQKQLVGMVGAYREDSLPREIYDKLSMGLTRLGDDGSILPGLAKSWDIKDGGKTYIFHLQKNLFFHDGKPVTSSTVAYHFSDVVESRPDNSTIVLQLKDAYSPFLVTVSKPVFDSGFSGVGDYLLKKVELNSNFIQVITLQSRKDHSILSYTFFPTEGALKTAYLLGEVTEAKGITLPIYNSLSFQQFSNTKVDKVPNYSRLVTLFFNTTNDSLSDKRLRLALSYALPDTFAEGERSSLPYKPTSLYYNQIIDARKQDFNHAKLLLLPDTNASGSAAKSPKSVTIKTLSKYKGVADIIAKAWKQIGIEANIEKVDQVPKDYQIFLGDFKIPNDPDQYTLWHSDQQDNIMHYKNLRIDKLLEDGRKTVALSLRQKIYADFQKYLLEDSPAAFLYFPTEYTLMRK